MIIPSRETHRLRRAQIFSIKFLLAITFTTIVSLGIIISVLAQTGKRRLLIPIGGGYTDIYTGFTSAAVANARKNYVNILVLPIGYASAPDHITSVERDDNLDAAELRRFEIEKACLRIAPADFECRVTLAPVFTRSDALDSANQAYFSNDLAAIFILGGDQSVAMRVINGTPIEVALNEAYVLGTIIAGTSAGGSILSSAMIAGYNPTFADFNALQFGAVDVWNSAEKHGLPFAIHDAILEGQFFQRGRFGRLINAISLPDSPHVGIGIDAYTGVYLVQGRMLENVFGRYSVAILDAETYHAAQAVRYVGPDHILSLRNVLVHLLSPGYSAFDLLKRQHSLSAPADKQKRSFDAFDLPAGNAPILLAGDLSQDLPGNPILRRFESVARRQSGGTQAKILIVAAGFSSSRAAQQMAAKFAAQLELPVQFLVVGPDSDNLDLPATNRYDAILFIAQDQSILAANLPQLSFIKDAWQAGKPVLADNAAAAALGEFFSALPPTPIDEEAREAVVQRSLIQGSTKIVPGLGLVNLNAEPQLITDNRWGRLFSLAYSQPEVIALGLPHNTVVEISPAGAVVSGENVVFTLDLRSAQLDLGMNRGFVIANGLLDVFAPGERLQPITADTSASPALAATPDLSTPTPTFLPTATPLPSLTLTPTEAPSETLLHGRPTRTPRPTATPLVIPPPSDPVKTNQMIGVGSLVVLVIVFGILMNRRRIRSNGNQ
jgi:cyanophycinase